MLNDIVLKYSNSFVGIMLICLLLSGRATRATGPKKYSKYAMWLTNKLILFYS